MLALTRDRLAPGRPLDTFFLETIEDDALRRARSEHLSRHARPLAIPAFEIIEG